MLISNYNFEIGPRSYDFLKKGKFSIWGYDRKLRPVIFFDLFEVYEENYDVLIAGFNLLMGLAYSKMMIPGINDGVLIVFDTCYRHFYSSMAVR